MKFVWGVCKDGENIAVPEGVKVGFESCVILFSHREGGPFFYQTAASIYSTRAPDFPPDLTLDEKKAWCEAQWMLMR